MLKAFLDIELLTPSIAQDEETLIYNNGNININVKVSSDRETVWLSQAQIEELFDTTQSNVSMHISNVLSESELDDSVYKDFLYMVGNGRNYQTAIFNLDMILAVGYRVKSNIGLYISIITRSSMTASSWLITKNVILSEHL